MGRNPARSSFELVAPTGIESALKRLGTVAKGYRRKKYRASRMPWVAEGYSWTPRTAPVLHLRLRRTATDQLGLDIYKQCSSYAEIL